MVLSSVSTPCGNIYRQPWQAITQFSEVLPKCPNQIHTGAICKLKLTEGQTDIQHGLSREALHTIYMVQGVPEKNGLLFLFNHSKNFNPLAYKMISEKFLYAK